ncbi:MAG: helix-turn-helix domain-containing protein [Nitrospinae bacterium]|nr:helix-turn-helix domain-containing protein [Nitrospinota bacterium]
MSDTLGKVLASARTKRGLTVEDVAKVTRINAKFIRMIEADQYEQLPGAVFIKGLLRSYAGVVGLSGDEMVARYDSLGLPVTDRSPQLISMPLRPRGAAQKIAGAGLLVFMAIFGFLYYLARPAEVEDISLAPTPVVKPQVTPPPAPLVDEAAVAPEAQPAVEPGKTSVLTPAIPPAPVPAASNKPAEPIKPFTAPSIAPVKPAPAPQQQVLSPKPVDTVKPVKASTVKPGPTPVLVKPAEPVKPAVETRNEPPLIQENKEKGNRLTISADAESWIGISVDGQEPKQAYLKAGEKITWRGDRKFRITIGNAAATKVFLNGREVKLSKPLQNVIKDMEITVPAQ